MYPIEFHLEEKIQIVDEKARILENEKAKEVCVVITNERFFLFEDGTIYQYLKENQ